MAPPQRIAALQTASSAPSSIATTLELASAAPTTTAEPLDAGAITNHQPDGGDAGPAESSSPEPEPSAAPSHTWNGDASLPAPPELSASVTAPPRASASAPGPWPQFACDSAEKLITAYSIDDADVRIDADLGEWNRACWRPLTVVGKATPDSDSSQIALRYSANTLYIALRVTDVDHAGPGPFTAAKDLWQFDALQVAIDNLGQDSEPYEAEFGWALSSQRRVISYRWLPAPAGTPRDVNAEVAVDARETRYEIAISSTALGIPRFGADQQLKFNVSLTDVDEGEGTSNHAELGPGIVGNKTSLAFPEIVWK